MRSLLRAVLATLIATGALVSAWTVAPVPPAASYPLGEGLWVVLDEGSVAPFGDAQFYGSMRGTPLSSPIVGMAAFPFLEGYWLAAADGGIFAFGRAGFHGSLGDLELNKPIVGIAPTPSGQGYWMVASDGGVFAFGDAGFFGSEGDRVLNKPIVGIAATPTGQGYWLVASDGGIFTHGDAAFHGSEGALPLNRPIIAMASTPSGAGYHLVASDGGMFTHGDATFQGSTGGQRLNAPITAMVPSTSGKGYTLIARDGGTFAFGDAPFLGSVADRPLIAPIVSAALRPRLAASVVPFADSDQAISRWAQDRSNDWRLNLIYLGGERPSGAQIPGIEGIDVAQLGTISFRRLRGGCLDFVLGYDAGAGLVVQNFPCDSYNASSATHPFFRPADVVPGDAKVLALQVRNTESLFSERGGPAEIDDITVAGITVTGPGIFRQP